MSIESLAITSSKIKPKYLELPDHRDFDAVERWLHRIYQRPSPSFRPKEFNGLDPEEKKVRSINTYLNLLEFAGKFESDEKIQDRLLSFKSKLTFPTRKRTPSSHESAA